MQHTREEIMRIKDFWAELALIPIMLLGLAFRLQQIGRPLNLDEITTSSISNHTSAYIVQYSLNCDSNPPLYYLFAHWSTIILGAYSSFSIRLPSLILGLLVIPLLYLIGKEIKNKTLGLLLASMVSIIYTICWYSTEARAYSLVFFAFAGAIYFFIRIFKGDKRQRCIFGLSFFAALCLWSHFYSALPLLIIGIILLDRDRALALQSILYTGIMLIPMAILFNYAQFRTRTIGNFGNPFWPNWYYLVQWIPNELFGLSWILIFPLIAYGIYRHRDNLLLVYFALIGGITAIEIIPLSLVTNISQRYALLISPLLLAVAFYPVSEWIDKQSTVCRKAGLFIVVIAVFFVINLGSTTPWV
jgi:uncharacterized membrane protein